MKKIEIEKTGEGFILEDFKSDKKHFRSTLMELYPLIEGYLK